MGLIADSSAFLGQQTCFGTNAFSCDSKRSWEVAIHILEEIGGPAIFNVSWNQRIYSA